MYSYKVKNKFITQNANSANQLPNLATTKNSQAFLTQQNIALMPDESCIPRAAVSRMRVGGWVAKCGFGWLNGPPIRAAVGFGGQGETQGWQAGNWIKQHAK